MTLPENIKQEIMETFQAELGDHLKILNTGLLSLEQAPAGQLPEALIDQLFRSAHSLKGAARAVGLRDIVSIAHRLEEILGAFRRKAVIPTAEMFDIILPSLDMMKQALTAHLAGQSLPMAPRDQLLAALESILQQPSSLRGQARPAPAPAPEPEKAPAANPEPATDAVPDSETSPDREPAAVENPDTTDCRLPAMPADDEATVRVATAKVDALMDGMGELLVSRMRFEQRLEELQTLQQAMAGWQKRWRAVRSHFNFLQRQEATGAAAPGPLFDFLAENADNLKKHGQAFARVVDLFSHDQGHLDLLAADLQENIRRVRMLPVATLFDLFPRMVRDLARERGKLIGLQIEGGASELDRHVLEAIKDPLIHLVRNAVGHGIETADRRRKAGKPPKGTLALQAAQKGSTIVLQVSDDGAGVDLAAVREQAAARKLLTARDAMALSDSEAVDYIFRSGFSTRAKTTELSGRGVGLDVVRHNLEKLHGLVQVETVSGRGTTFALTLPLTLATSQVLLLDVADQTLAVPVTNVGRILRIAPSEVGSIEGRPAISLDGRALPLVSLARTLGLAEDARQKRAGQSVQVVTLGLAEKRVAFRVDGFAGAQEVVIKPLGPQLQKVPNIAGATILGSGRVVMVLSVPELLKRSDVAPADVAPTVTARTSAAEVARGRHRVLVVDDSITTRTLEKNILENAGFDVLIAADGEEAWALIQSEPPDVIVADVDMPRMDGFTLTENVKTDDRYRDIPVVLVTSMDRRQDTIRGMEAGANAYLTKQSFEQQTLLETIEKLIA